MAETIVMHGAILRLALLKNANVSPKMLSLETGKDISQISRFLRAERCTTDKIKKQIYRFYKKKHRGTAISFDVFWGGLLKISIDSLYSE